LVLASLFLPPGSSLLVLIMSHCHVGQFEVGAGLSWLQPMPLEEQFTDSLPASALSLGGLI
jgi:hypothetical protein